MTNLLFEITTYDVPYDLQLQTEKDIKSLWEEILNKLNVSYSEILSFSTNRRIVIYIPEIDEVTKPIVNIKKGPPTSTPHNIVEKFLTSNKISLNDCYKEKTPKGEFYFFKQIIPQDLLTNLLAKIVTEEILSKVNFKRSMFWNDSKVKWSRPITNLVLLLGDISIGFKFAGVSSTNRIQGQVHLNNFLVLKKAEDYFKVIDQLDITLLSFKEKRQKIIELQKKLLELSPLKTSREEIIVDTIINFAETNHLTPNLNESLLVELLYLTESPVVLFGNIPNKYLSLPKELLVNTLVKNQRYINFFNLNGGLSTHFALVSNINAPDNGDEIIKGNQRVLNARLEDGLFFYDLDIKEDWSQKGDDLKNVLFFNELGSLFDKQERLKALAAKIFPANNLQKICGFCKVDLVSKVVGEFPDLQGIMGYYYAKRCGLNEEEALAIKEQYLPLSSHGKLPDNILGAKLAFLDKLDTLISFFNIGKLPTSSGDPYALRRAALGVIRIAIEHKFSINLKNYLSPQLLEFFQERLIIYLDSLNIKKDITLAVIDFNNFDIFIISQKAYILNYCIKENRDLISLYKRVYNILYNNDIDLGIIKKELFIGIEEKVLYEKIVNLDRNFINLDNYEEKELSPINEIEKYKEYIKEVLNLKHPIDNFLNNTLILNPKNLDITNNRLQLLKLVLLAIKKIGNLEKINFV